MEGSSRLDIDENLRALRAEEEKKRRRTEQAGGLMLSGTSLVVMTIFLWILAASQKRPLELVMTLTVAGGSIALFAWGLKIAIIGRKP